MTFWWQERAAARWMILGGACLESLGVGIYLWTLVRVDEKASAFLLLGHWLDLEWEVAFPVAAAGVLLMASGLLCHARAQKPPALLEPPSLPPYDAAR